MEKDKISIIKFLLRLGAFLQRKGDRLLEEFGITQQQFIVIKEIQEKKPKSQKEICSVLLFEKSNVSKIIKKLHNKKLIDININPDDQRITMLQITKSGEQLIDNCMSKLNSWNIEYLSSLTSTETKQAFQILSKLDLLSQ